LNNDLEIISPGWLKRNGESRPASGVGAVGAKTFFWQPTPSSTRESCWESDRSPDIPQVSVAKRICFMARLHVVCNYSAVTAAVWCCDEKLFDEAGGLDEKNLAIAFTTLISASNFAARGY